MSNVVIIGAGIGGLATANLLAKSGHKVSIYEKQPSPGGRAGSLKIDGFTFDTGPSWYLMPEVFSHYYDLLGEDVHQHLALKRLDPAYKVFFQDEPDAVTIHADLAHDKQTFEQIETGAGDKLVQYLDKSQEMYQAALDNFLYTNFDDKKSMLKLDVIKLLPRLARAALTPIDNYVGQYFADRRLKQIMEYPMVFLGTSPFEAPALYSLMSHMDFNQGVFYPQNGMYTIIESLMAIGRKLGVNYNFNSPVTAIQSENGVAHSIELARGDVIEADIIISNADLHFTETRLLQPKDQTYPEAYWRKKQAGPSALLMYLGVKGEIPELIHHNLLFTKDWRANFDAIFKHKSWPTPASIYICKPSATDASVAPNNHENMFVLVPVPAKLGTNKEELTRLADGYLQQIAEMTGIHDLIKRITVKRLVGPDDFAQDFNSWQGTALGLSHTLMQSALFRPANKSKKLQNLYYVGGNTMPGIGLPMCLIGAELIYKRLTGDSSAGPLKEISHA